MVNKRYEELKKIKEEGVRFTFDEKREYTQLRDKIGAEEVAKIRKERALEDERIINENLEIIKSLYDNPTDLIEGEMVETVSGIDGEIRIFDKNYPSAEKKFVKYDDNGGIWTTHSGVSGGTPNYGFAFWRRPIKI